MLDGLKVIELAEGVAGPLAALRLSELGASVVKVEPAAGDYLRGAFPRAEGESAAAAFIELNRGKRSVRGDESKPATARLLAHLVGNADVLITDRPDAALEKLGLAPSVEASEQGTSRLIVISLTPWGRRGPLAAR